jgi:serine/threonine protein kinase
MLDSEVLSQVGDYEILNVIGDGAFSTVYRARHLSTQCPVALKAIAKKSLTNPTDLQILQKEVSLMKRMDHPFIVTLYEVTEDNSNIYLAMELVENGTLLEFINKRGHLDEDEARYIFFQILSALEYLHFDRFVVHRDLKAENILIDSNRIIRIVDFGLSRMFTTDNPF